MKVFDLFSKRLRDESQAGKTEVFQYESIPDPLRRQMRKIVEDGFGKEEYWTGYGSVENRLYKTVRDILCREYGKDYLVHNGGPYADLMDFVLTCSTIELLDCVELAATAIDRVARDYPQHEKDKWEISDPDSLLEEINYRFRRAGSGYQLLGTRIIRADSQFIHSEAVKPALNLLSSEGYEGPQQEFLDSFKHLKDGNYREAIVDAANAFESTMKAVCEKKAWSYPANPRASDLIKTLNANKLFPDYLDRSFDQLIATLGSGLPQARDSSAAHGQGASVVDVPEYIAAYALHLAASKIVLIVTAAERPN